ncbi:MAG: glycosyltransferase [Candidatus Woesearchaeota archaeon]|nr:glycosyltransferase [Candidatus Woesearchaeota archaeon]
MISIVIPAYNEEEYLPKLLESIKKQDFSDYEIIVADSSADDTRKIAKGYGCIVTKGGRPAKARNNGSLKASHDILFLDSDVILPDNFLKEFARRCKKYDLASCYVHPTSRKLSHKIYYSVKNWLNATNPIKHCSGQCLFIRKKIFRELNGYDESLYLGEEHELVQRAVKCGNRYTLFKDIYVLNSPRRIEKEGFFRLTFKSLYSEAYRLLFKKMKSDIIAYDYEYEPDK